MEYVGGQLGIIAAAFTLDLLDDQLGIILYLQLPDPSDSAVLSPKMRALYFAILLVSLKSRCKGSSKKRVQ
jgi:hypothetical protein